MDLRTERTKRSIINAFLELRAKKPLEKITVKELSELAFINKATFYSHYHDIYDLSEQLEEEVISSVLRSIPHSEHIITNPTEAVMELTLAMTSRHELLHILFSGSREGILVKKLENGLKEKIYAQYPDYRGNLTWDITLSVLIHGCFQAFMEHSDADIHQVIPILCSINECLTESILSK